MSGESARPIYKVTCSSLCIPSFYPCMYPSIHPRFLLSFLSPCFPMSIGSARPLQVTCSFISLSAFLPSIHPSFDLVPLPLPPHLPSPHHSSAYRRSPLVLPDPSIHPSIYLSIHRICFPCSPALLPIALSPSMHPYCFADPLLLSFLRSFVPSFFPTLPFLTSLALALHSFHVSGDYSFCYTFARSFVFL